MNNRIWSGLMMAGVLSVSAPLFAQVVGGGSVGGAVNGVASGSVNGAGSVSRPPVRETVGTQTERVGDAAARADAKARATSERAAERARTKTAMAADQASDAAAASKQRASNAASSVTPPSGVSVDKSVTSEGAVDAGKVSGSGKSATNGNVAADRKGAKVNADGSLSAESRANTPR